MVESIGIRGDSRSGHLPTCSNLAHFSPHNQRLQTSHLRAPKRTPAPLAPLAPLGPLDPLAPLAALAPLAPLAPLDPRAFAQVGQVERMPSCSPPPAVAMQWKIEAASLLLLLRVHGGITAPRALPHTQQRLQLSRSGPQRIDTHPIQFCSPACPSPFFFLGR